MEIINYTLNEELYLPNNYLSSYKNLPFAIFDIETTGLSPEYSHVILIGILYIENNKTVIQQFFCHHRREEGELLEAFTSRVKGFDMLISYNGDAFDIPFLNKRLGVHRIPFRIDSRRSFDILKFVRKKRSLLNLDDCKLKSVERSLDIYRTDTISGKESVDLYKLYEHRQNKQLKEKILLHNYDDLYYFSKCLHVLDKVDYEEFLGSSPFLFPIQGGQLCSVQKVMIKGSMLIVSGVYATSLIGSSQLCYQLGYSFEYNHITNAFELQVPLMKGSLSSGEYCLYVNMEDLPFHYNGHTKEFNIPDNLVVLKLGKQERNVEIYNFISYFLGYILSNL